MHAPSPCANRLCTKYEPGTESCHARHGQPRWAALAAMWMWKHGGFRHWRVP